MTDLPKKKPYTKDQFYTSALNSMKGISGGIDRNMMINNIIEKGNKLRKQGVSRQEVIGIIKKAKTAHGHWYRNARKRELRRRMK